jgi:hypothetical protein
MMRGSNVSSSSVLRALAGCATLLLGLGAATTVAGQPRGAAQECRADAPLAALRELPEASGLAASRSVPGRLWSHNDSGQPVLFALDARGSVTGRVLLSGVAVDDWEAVAVGPCPAGSCLYVGDIGDNDAERKRITVYRVQEPSGAEPSLAVKDAFHATYPDGPHDAETLLVTPAGRLFIVTKGDTGPVGLYRFPEELRPGATHRLERVGRLRESGQPADRERITDGSMSADGQWVVLRTTQSLTFHNTAELTAGNWREARRVDLEALGEVQGEGVAIGAGNTVYVVGEGGGKSRPGTFARLACAADTMKRR